MPQLQPKLAFGALSYLLIVFLSVILVAFTLVSNVEGEPVWLAV
jgi:hypothetical protein